MPTYLGPVKRVTFAGTTMSTAEEWATGFWLGTMFGDSTPPDQEEADALKTLWQTFFTAPSSKFWNGCKTDYVKVALVGANGQSDPNNSVFAYYSPAISGASTDTGIIPPQCSLVATITSPKARGYASKGRMYLPGNNAPISSDGKINSTTVNTINTNFKTFLDGVNAHADIDGFVVLNSAASVGVPSHPALIEAATGCRIGNVYDTQRRRRNQLQEVYSTAVLA